MSCTLTVLAVDSLYHPPSVVVTTENGRFLFEVGEGVQRLAVEHKVKVGKIRSIFCSSCLPHSVGGLTGILLTLEDAGVGKIDIIGPTYVQSFLQSTQNFTRPIGNYILPQLTSNSNQLQPYLNKELTVYPVPLSIPATSSSSASVESTMDHFCYLCETPAIAGKFLVEIAEALGVPKGPSYGQLKNGKSIALSNGSIVTPEQVLAAPIASQYFAIITSLDACLMVHQQDNHEDSDNSQQQTISSASLRLLETLIRHPQLVPFQQHQQLQQPADQQQPQTQKQQSKQKSQPTKKHIQVMVHYSSSIITDHPLYQAWLISFGSETTHLFLGHRQQQQTAENKKEQVELAMEPKSSSSSSSSFLAEQVYHDKLAHLFPSYFSSIQLPSPLSSSSSSATIMVQASPLMKYVLLPLKRAGLITAQSTEEEGKKKEETEQSITEQAVVGAAIVGTEVEEEEEEVSDGDTLQAFLASLDPQLLTKVADFNNNRQELANDNLRLYFLGTGCAIPSKYRNVSGCLLYNTDKQAGLLMDCGEGSWYQLMHFLPPTLKTGQEEGEDGEEEDTLSNREMHWARIVKVIWISHLHADHHLGSLTIILKRQQLLLTAGKKKPSALSPLIIIAPMMVLKFLEEVLLLYQTSYLHCSSSSGCSSFLLQDAFIGIPSNCFDPLDLCQPCSAPSAASSSSSFAISYSDSNDSKIAEILQRNAMEVVSLQDDLQEFLLMTSTLSTASPTEIIDASNAAQTAPTIIADPMEIDISDTLPPTTVTSTMDVTPTAPAVVSGVQQQQQSPSFNHNDSNNNVTNQKKRRRRLDMQPRMIFSSLSSSSITSGPIIPPEKSLIFANLQQAKAILLQELAISELLNVPVIHCPQACGLILTMQKTKDSSGSDSENMIKFVYSGDTRPCENLVTWGQHADILLHEATFEDDKVAEAITKRHSTISEARGIQEKMQAKHSILTHFSQRYHGVPSQFHPKYNEAMAEEGKTVESEVTGSSSQHQQQQHKMKRCIVAFDFMMLNDLQLEEAQEMTSLLAEIFPATAPLSATTLEEDLPTVVS